MTERALHIREAQPGDAEHLAPRLREADLRELEAATAEVPLAALQRSILHSVPCLAVVADAVIALSGVVPDGPDRGIIWMVGSDWIVQHPSSFARISRPLIDRLQERYRVVWNFIDARNTVHVRWIEWCGFTIHRTVEAFGVGRLPFHQFSRVRPEGGSGEGA